jgi:ABC-type multidrug transport system fused ATPase/permease subunit
MFASILSQSAIRLFVGLLRPYRWRIFLALVLTTAGCLLALPIPLLIQRLIDQASGREFVSLPAAGGLIFLALLAQAGSGLAATLIMGRVALNVVWELRRRVYQRLLHSECNASPGVILSRLTDDVASVQNLVSAQTVGVLTDVGAAGVVAVWLLWLSPMQFAVAAVFVPLIVTHFRSYTQRIRSGATDIRQRLDKIFVQLKEKLDGAVVVKGHAREEAEEAAFEAQMDSAHEPRIRLGRLTTGFSIGGQLIAGLGVMAVFFVGAFGVTQGQLTAGEVAAAATLTALLFSPLARLADVVGTFEQAAASGVRLAELMQLPTRTVNEEPCTTPIGRARGRIEFSGVGFAYDSGPAVLHDVELLVEPGERVAIVGPSASGKSTLLNLLLRFHDPDGGEVRLDGVPLTQLSLADLRRQIGLVPQDPNLFRGTLADNIRYGCPQAAMNVVEAAARACGVDLIAARLPLGYATVIGEGGHPLSAGERQRIAIARAICTNPPIVLLDEATSNLDPIAEAEVQTALSKLLEGRTAIIVAHRLATVRDADRIVVLDGGRIVQEGSHTELLRDSAGLYHRFVNRQFGSAAAA